MTLCIALWAHAQLLEITDTRRVALPEGYRVDQANISPDGSFAVISTLSGDGLTKIDLSSGKATLLTPTGSNYDLQFTSDGRNIVYREVVTGKDKLRRVAVKSTDVTTKKTSTILKPTRDLQAIAVNGTTANTIEKGHLTTKALSGNSEATPRPILSIDRGQLCITRDGRTKTLSPVGTDGKSYIWQSLSPNGKKILFYVVGDGCYTCDLNGSDIKSLGTLRAPVWYDDNTVIGMVNESNGYVITASQLVASNIDGTVKQVLTKSDMTAVYPSATKGKITFTTPQGELYIITLKK